MTLCFNNSCKQPITRGGDIASAVKMIGGIYAMPKSSQAILDKYGDINIVLLTIKRNPIRAMKYIKKLQIDIPYDELYHLYCTAKLANGMDISFEKNETVKVSQSSANNRGNDTDYLVVQIGSGLTLNSLFKNSLDKIGELNFYKYSAKDRNCQDWILNLLQHSGLKTTENERFIKQVGTDDLFNKNTRKLSNVITDTSAFFNTLRD